MDTFNEAAILARIRAGAMAGVQNAAEIVREEAIRSMVAEPKSGRKYPDLPNQSSAPGEAPARQFGRLIAGIDIRPDPAQLKATVNAGTAYSAALEFGTEKMAPRPFLRPALYGNEAEIEAAITSAIRAAL